MKDQRFIMVHSPSGRPFIVNLNNVSGFFQRDGKTCIGRTEDWRSDYEVRESIGQIMDMINADKTERLRDAELALAEAQAIIRQLKASNP